MEELKILEIQRAEKVLMDSLPPLARIFVNNSRKINAYIEVGEELLLSIMNENGTVNGKLLGEIINEKYPKFSQWINIPQTDFYLKDEVESLMKGVFGK